MINNIILLLLGMTLLNGFMYLQQPSMTFFPYATFEQTPADWGLVYEDVYLDTEDGVRLHGWYIPHLGAVAVVTAVAAVAQGRAVYEPKDGQGRAVYEPKDGQGSDANEPKDDAKQTLLFFHGNAGNISHRGSSIEIFHRLGLNVFIIDYRGFGKSQGKADEKGIYKDASAAWHYLIDKRKQNPNDIIVFGRSLGGVVATQLAARVQPGGLIIESTFSSARDVANAVFPILSRLVFLRYDFDNVSHIKQVRSPVLVLHSPDDEIIPIRLGEKVFQAANEPKSFFKMRGGHNDGFVMSQPDYELALGEFISAFGK